MQDECVNGYIALLLEAKGSNSTAFRSTTDCGKKKCSVGATKVAAEKLWHTNVHNFRNGPFPNDPISELLRMQTFRLGCIPKLMKEVKLK